MRPSFIRYTQDTISSHFQFHQECIDTCIQSFIDNHQSTIDSQRSFDGRFTPLHCFRLGRDVYSLDNRRLFVGRILENRHVLETILVILFPFEHQEVQRIVSSGVPHWVSKASSNNRDGKVKVDSRLSRFVDMDRGCERVSSAFVDRSCIWTIPQRRDVDVLMVLCNKVMRHEGRFGKHFAFSSMSSEELKERVLRRIARGIGASQRQCFVDFADSLIADYIDLKAEFERVWEHLRLSLEMIVIALPTEFPSPISKWRQMKVWRRPLASALQHDPFAALQRHVSEYNLGLGYRRLRGGEVEIVAWPDAACESYTSFEKGLGEIRLDLRTCYAW